MPVVDGLVAATVRVHDMTLVTRNSLDVEGLGIAESVRGVTPCWGWFGSSYCSRPYRGYRAGHRLTAIVILSIMTVGAPG